MTNRKRDLFFSNNYYLLKFIPLVDSSTKKLYCVIIYFVWLFFSMWKTKDISMIVLTVFVDKTMKQLSKWSFITQKKKKKKKFSKYI